MAVPQCGIHTLKFASFKGLSLEEEHQPTPLSMHGLPLSQHKHGMDAMGGGCGGVVGMGALELGWGPGGALGVEEKS